MKLLILLITITLILVWWTIRSYKQSKTNKINYPKQYDPTEQKKYESKYNNIKKLSLKELTELSWKFLYEITKVIFKRFSREDQNIVTRIGEQLYRKGMRYQHVVNSNPSIAQRHALDHSRTTSQTRNR